MVEVAGTKLNGCKGILPAISEEIDDFEKEVARFRRGEWDPNAFMAFRTKQGVVGQRQPDAHMVRVKIPQGVLTAEMLEALGAVARDYAGLKKGHVTTRENIQLHFIKLEDMATIMRLVGAAGLTTREAGGNTMRNVIGSPMAGVCSKEPFDTSPYAAAYSRYFLRHPLTQQMPRKFKASFSCCDDDDSISEIHDLGFIPKVRQENGKLRKGFLMRTGGGLSIMPRIGYTLYDFVPVEDYLRVSEAVVRVFDRSDELRENRMRARLKFLIDRVGIDAFRDMVEEELRQPWAQQPIDPTPLLHLEGEEIDAPPPASNGHHADGHQDPEFASWRETNVVPQKQAGYYAVLVNLPLGDIQAGQFAALAEIARKYAGGRARTTIQQNLVLRWVREDSLYEVWKGLHAVGLGEAGGNKISDVTSCPGTDSCKLGITSSMGLTRALTETAKSLVGDDPLINDLHIKISGCPNSCGQHHLANIGFHGATMKGAGNQIPAYDIYLGGSYTGNGLTGGAGVTRIGKHLKARVPAKRVPRALRLILGYYKDQRQEQETFNRFIDRVGLEPFQAILAELREVGPLNRESIDTYMDWGKTVLYKLERGEGECAV